jgi:hypothetical protein
LSENRIITDTSELIQQPKDAFWDAPVSRRMYQEQLNKVGRHIAELYGAINKMSMQLAELYGAMDTNSILINFIMEKKLMTDKTPVEIRDEVEAFVKEKKAKAELLQAGVVAQVGAINNEPSNG